ncbi:MAG: DNA polymerase III subunit gamma/tau [Acidobacteriota bacterium]
MSYQVLARKWRPQDFSSLVGQDHLVTALRNALVEGRIAQAYLFSGIRGVGKTTAARVLAKALSCERGPAADPCNECDTCLEISAGASMDVLEVDAATYSKVEQVRELTETLRYGPTRNRYKVVVLDEVHRLSRQAFDALLKIVEEPPPHLVFIFATTEIDAVPATILSRCQEFQFKRVPSPVLAEHLRTISTAETIEVSDAALRMIARAGEGSVRDSVALLDQMATFGGGAISDDEAQQLLGGLDSAVFLRLLQAITTGDAADVVAIVRDIERNGWDPQTVYAQFLGYLRDALHIALSASRGAPPAVDLPDEEARRLAEVTAPLGHEALLQVVHLLLQGEPTVRRSELGLLALEIAWLRAAELPKVQSIQALLAGGPSAGGPPGRGSGGASSSGASGGGRRGGPPPRHGGTRGASASPSVETLDGPAGGAADLGDTPRVAENRAEGGASSARDTIGLETVEETRVEATRAEDAVVEEAVVIEARTEETLVLETGAVETGASETGAPETSDHATESPVVSAVPAGVTAGIERLPALLELLSSRRQNLAAQLRKAHVELRASVLHVAPPDRFLARALGRQRNASALDEAILEIWGAGVSWQLAEPRGNGHDALAPKVRTNGGAGPRALDDAGAERADRARPFDQQPPGDVPPDERAQSSGRSNGQPTARGFGPVRRDDDPAVREAETLPTVKAILDLFGGKIQGVMEEEIAS